MIYGKDMVVSNVVEPGKGVLKLKNEMNEFREAGYTINVLAIVVDPQKSLKMGSERQLGEAKRYNDSIRYLQTFYNYPAAIDNANKDGNGENKGKYKLVYNDYGDEKDQKRISKYLKNGCLKEGLTEGLDQNDMQLLIHEVLMGSEYMAKFRGENNEAAVKKNISEGRDKMPELMKNQNDISTADIPCNYENRQRSGSYSIKPNIKRG